MTEPAGPHTPTVAASRYPELANLAAPSNGGTLSAGVPLPTSPYDGDNVRIRDFSYNPPPIEFTADGDVFYGYPVLGASTIQDLSNVLSTGHLTPTPGQDRDIAETLETIAQLFDAVLKPESAELFRTRIFDRERPLDLRRQVIPIVQWILERHGLRPTQPSSSSSTGSQDETDGTTSAAGAQPNGSTPPS